MKISYDPRADAAYIKLVNEDEETWGVWTYPCDTREVKGMTNLDFEMDGRLVGVEVMDASRKLSPELLEVEAVRGGRGSSRENPADGQTKE